MILEKIGDIEIKDINELITSAVQEDKSIEYKRELSVSGDSQKKEFLADVASFANASGGDLIFGVEAYAGVPTGLRPLAIADIDAEVLRIEGIIRTGISPRVSTIVHRVPTGNQNEYAIVIRIGESWNKPHRVTYGGSNRFCARTSAGKYDLDVEELRQIFTLSDGIEKRMADFRTERLFAIEIGNTTLPLTSKNLVIVHLLPLESFSTKVVIDQNVLLSLERESDLAKPMYHINGWNPLRVNLEGMFSYSGTINKNAHSLVQVFRNGAIELVNSSILDRGDGDIIGSGLLESEIIDGVERALKIMKKIEIGRPVLVAVSLMNVKGMTMTRGNGTSFGRGRFDSEHPILQKDLILSGELLEDETQTIGRLLRPVFDLVWNACGIPKSQNYNEDGTFFSH